MRLSVIAQFPDEIILAVHSGGMLRAFHLWRGGQGLGYGALVCGRVSRLLPELSAAIIDCGDGGQGFLRLGSGESCPCVGVRRIFRVQREAPADKLPVLSIFSRSEPKDQDQRLGLCMRRSGALPAGLPIMNFLKLGVRSLCYEGSFVSGKALAQVCSGIKGIEVTPWRRAGLLWDELGLDDEISALLSPQVDLPEGGRLFIEPTMAFTAIDVDTHKASEGSRALRSACLAAARMIPLHLALRGLGGPIMIDFPLPLKGMASKEPPPKGVSPLLAEILGILRGELRRNKLGGTVCCVAATGLVMISLPRRFSAFHEIVMKRRDPYGWCLTIEHRCYDFLRSLLRAPVGLERFRLTDVDGAIVERLRGSLAPALTEVERILGRVIDFS